MTLKLRLKKFRRAARLAFRNVFWSEILVLGDSHLRVFRRKSMKKHLKGSFFHVVTVGGATLTGLDNPESKTRARARLLEGLTKSRASVALVQMGEVDAGFVIWHRAEKYNREPSVMLMEAVSNYQDFLLQVRRQMAVVCISAPLPTIGDGIEWGEIAHARREIKASQDSRTKLTLELNRLMEEFCRHNDIDYLSLDEISMGEGGLVTDALLNSDPSNHHYDPQAYEEVLIHGLRKIDVMRQYFHDSNLR